MDLFLNYPREDRKLLFKKAKKELDISLLAVIEKDFWVCWTLQKLSEIQELKENLIFKGGTSLSKVFNLIDRFSEDIDLIIDRKYLDLNYTTTNFEKQKKKIREACKNKIKDTILPLLKERIEKILGKNKSWKIEVDENDSQSILFYYPSVFDTQGFPMTFPVEFNEDVYGYIKPVIKLEFGSLSLDNPSDFKIIKPYVASLLELFLDKKKSTIETEFRTIDVNRTFWDKISILHKVANSNKEVTMRYSRHYYNVFKFIKSDYHQDAFKQKHLLEETVENNSRFFVDRCNIFETKLGNLKLIPDENKLSILKQDYENMSGMFFREAPDFIEIVEEIFKLEEVINKLE